MKSYEDARFGVNKYLSFVNTASVAGTTGTTELQRQTVMEACTVTDWNLVHVTGGTDAGVRSIILSTSLAGTGALVGIGTATLGTAANGTVQDAACTATALANGDDLVISVIGTTAAVNVVRPVVMMNETFVNA